MSTRRLAVLGAIAALAACQPAVPDSGYSAPADRGRGVGFDDPRTLAARQVPEAQPNETFLPPTQATAAQSQPGQQPAARTAAQRQTTRSSPRAAFDPQNSDAELADIAARNDAAAAAANSGQQVVNASPSNAAPVILNNPGISDENNFDAVSSRQSIESDAARLENNRQQYKVVKPTALPRRTGNSQPNIVAYALQTQHSKGTKMYRRVNLASASKTRRNCAAYASDDEAQIDFLARGGPQRDRKNLDPDGDGYACEWDPAPFRRASGG